MDTVLGLSVTPTTVGLVLVEGQDGDGATVDRDAFHVQSHGLANAVQTSEQAATAVQRTEAVASIRGHRLHSIGVTWSDDADTEASLLLKSLSDAGFDNVVPVQLPEATEALAYGMADAMGYETTAVCVIEPESVVMLVVHSEDGAIQTAVNNQIDTDEGLIRWVSAVFTQADWQPQALVLVGSAGDLDTIPPQLEEALSVPVFAPAEAQLALARGAALASAHETEIALAGADQDGHGGDRAGHRSRFAPVAMLAAGAVTFVVSLSLALGLHFTPQKEPLPAAAEAKPAANMSRTAPPMQAVPPPPAAPAAPIVDPPLAPSPEVVPVEIAPPVEMPAEPSSGMAEAPAEIAEPVPAAPPIEAAPAAPPMGAAPAAPPVDAAGAGPPIEAAPAAPPGAVPVPPGTPPQPGAPPVAPAEPSSKPPLLTRVLSKIPGLHGGSDDEPEQAPAQMAPQQAPAPPPAGPAPPPVVPPPPPPVP